LAKESSGRQSISFMLPPGSVRCGFNNGNIQDKFPANEVEMSKAEDELAIRQLAAAYTDAVNTRNVEGMAGVYAPDGEIVARERSSRPVKGMPMLLKVFQKLMREREFLIQTTHSGVVEIHGDRATSRWWFSEIKKPAGSATYQYKVGVYQDEVVRLDTGWRYARRFADTLFVYELPISDAHHSPPPFLSLIALPGPT
jgi:ketosteroid isomerase-like protein